MPKTLWDARARNELVARLNSLAPDATPRWGQMTAPRMLAHLSDWMAMASGSLPTQPRKLFLRYTPVKQLAIFWLPFPKGVPTAKELITRAASDWSMERAALCDSIESFEKLHPDGVWPLHPAFGALTPRAWGVLGYRHTDHHLRQFGV